MKGSGNHKGSSFLHSSNLHRILLHVDGFSPDFSTIKLERVVNISRQHLLASGLLMFTMSLIKVTVTFTTLSFTLWMWDRYVSFASTAGLKYFRFADDSIEASSTWRHTMLLICYLERSTINDFWLCIGQLLLLHPLADSSHDFVDIDLNELRILFCYQNHYIVIWPD